MLKSEFLYFQGLQYVYPCYDVCLALVAVHDWRILTFRVLTETGDLKIYRNIL
jgi:hypothetical protein